MRDAIGCIAALFFLFALTNFCVFFVVSIIEGGDALNGKIENGKYYLAQHGKYTEVSEAVWYRSRFHAISTIVTTILGIVSGALMHFLSREPPSKGPTLDTR